MYAFCVFSNYFSEVLLTNTKKIQAVLIESLDNNWYEYVEFGNHESINDVIVAMRKWPFKGARKSLSKNMQN